MQLKKYSPEDYIFLPEIQITSPDQFVPLFVVAHSPILPNFYHNLLSSEDIFVRVPYEKMAIEDRDEMKKILLEQLNYPYPKSYSLPVLKDTFFYSGFIQRLGSHTFPGCILGEDHEDASAMNAVYHLGCWLSFTPTGPALNVPSKVFPFEEYITASLPNLKKGTLTPHLLFVVKAKLIPYLRARMYLELPFDLPVTDFKMLRNSNDALALPPDLSRYIKSLQPTVEYLTAEQILAYLIGPETEPKFKPTEKVEAIKKVQEMLRNSETIKPAMEYA